MALLKGVCWRPLHHCKGSIIPFEGCCIEGHSSCSQGNNEVEVVTACPTTSQALSSGCPATSSLAPTLAAVMPLRVVDPSAPSASMDELSKRRVPSTPLRLSIHITNSKEGDEYTHKSHFGVDNSALHNSQTMGELSKILFLSQDVERQSHSMEDIISDLFPALIGISLSYFSSLYSQDNMFLIN